jgi:hypothetical protein
MLVTKPRDDADRCETAEDCDQPVDKRYQAVCEFGDEGLEEGLDPEDVDMVCVAAFALVSCNLNDFNEGHPVYDLMESLSPPDYASLCDGDQAGNMGCPGPPCDDGLSANDDGICDDDDPNTPPAIRSNPDDYLYQDILDQFCRSFFCDRSFVCDTDGDTCKPCDPNMPYGNSGCGDLYINGELSCLYNTSAELDSSCQAPDSDWDNPTFGTCS